MQIRRTWAELGPLQRLVVLVPLVCFWAGGAELRRALRVGPGPDQARGPVAWARLQPDYGRNHPLLVLFQLQGAAAVFALPAGADSTRLLRTRLRPGQQLTVHYDAAGTGKATEVAKGAGIRRLNRRVYQVVAADGRVLYSPAQARREHWLGAGAFLALGLVFSLALGLSLRRVA